MRALLISFLLVMVTCSAVAQEDAFIYQVTASDCGDPLLEQIQTGFAVRGLPGIITALHGLVGCSTITAVSEGASLPNLSLDEVDVSRDLAIIGESYVPSGDGLIRGDLPSHPGRARVVGHPHAISGLHEMNLEIPNPPYLPLRELLPPRLFDALNARGSPTPSLTVLSLNGDLQIGHSGSPVFDENNRVVAVASGGLGSGEYGIGWAMPFQNAQWHNRHDEDAELLRLARLTSGALFSSTLQGASDQSYPRQVSLWRYTDGRVGGVFAAPNGNIVYVNTFQTVSVFNFDNDTVASIPVGALIQGMALSPDARKGYVVDARPHLELKIVDLAAKRIVQTVAMPQKKVCPPIITSNGELLLVPLPNDNQIWVYYTRNHTSQIVEIATRSPCAIATSRRSNNIYVGGWSPGRISVYQIGDFYRETNAAVNPKTVIAVDAEPTSLAESYDGSKLFVTQCRNDTVAIIDLNSGVQTERLGVGKCPSGVAVTRDSRWVYVANRDDATVSIIDAATNQVVDSVLVDRDPTFIAIPPGGHKVYIGHFYQNSVTLLN